MKAIILAAGQGTRLKKYTENLPKGMLSFDGKTIIERQIEMYRKCGIDNIIIVRGFAADKIKYDGITYYDNKDYASTNMVASFLCASDEFDEDVLVSYSDVLFCENMLRTMIKAEGEFVCAVDTNWQSYWMKRYGKVDFDTESMKIGEGENITSLGLSDPPIEEIDARYVGLLKFSRTGLRKIVSIWERDYEKYKDRGWQQSGKRYRRHI